MIKFAHLVLIGGIIACHSMHSGLFAQDTKWSPEQVYYGPGGKLTYTPDEQGNTIPDFSHVGYMYGDEPIPDIPTVVEVSPVEGDDGATIQAAINQVKAIVPGSNGYRGAVLLKKGTYQVTGKIFIDVSGIVLRGEGQTEDGTVVIADGTVKRDFVVIGKGNGFEVLTYSETDIVEDYVPVGRKFVVVDDASQYSSGDRITVYRPGTEKWISDIKMDQINNDDGQTSQWNPDGYSFHYERVVTGVSGDTIFFRNPIVMAMERQYGGGKVFKCRSNRIEKVGVEDIYFKSAYKSATDEEHAWKAVVFQSIEHGWVRNITSRYFGYACVSVEDAARSITVENCHSRDPISEISGGRRYSFNLSGSLALFKDCTTTEGRHDFVTGSRVKGPSVFTNCSATDAHADSGPHHRWATGTLYDIIHTDGALNVQDRGPSGSGHGWAGANQVFWNCTGRSSVCQSPWTSAKNYNFGFIGDKAPGALPDRPDGVWVGHNRPGIFPESLYQAQLESRQSDVGVFSVYPELEKVNDSSFILFFTLPILDMLATPTSFSVEGDAGFEGMDFSVELLSDTTLMLVFNNIGPLPAFSTVEVKVLNMLNTSGKALQGLTTATYSEPDLRPVINGLYAKVNNEDGMLQASSSKPGTIYLVQYSGNYNYLDDYKTIDDLNQAVAENLGRKVDAPEPNTPVTISTLGLPGGFYLYYAVDEDGRISLPADEWPEVEATGPLLGMGVTLQLPRFSVWTFERTLLIRPDDHTADYSARLFDMTGRIIAARESLKGEQQLMVPDYQGLLLVQLVSESGIGAGTYKLLLPPSR